MQNVFDSRIFSLYVTEQIRICTACSADYANALTSSDERGQLRVFTSRFLTNKPSPCCSPVRGRCTPSFPLVHLLPHLFPFRPHMTYIVLVGR